MRSVVGVLYLALSVAGCSAAGDGGGSGSGDRNGNNDHSGKAGTGAAGAGSLGSGGSFNVGNSEKPTMVTQVPVDNGQYIDGGLCEVGKFCEPESADGECGSLTLQSTVKMIPMPGNVLLIFDRSSSMTSDWNGMQRWQGAGSAMLAALTPLADLLTLGAVMYPSETVPMDDTFGAIGLACAVDPFSSTEQLAFQPGPMGLQALQAAPPSGYPNPIYAPIGTDPNPAPLGATPTMEAIQAADVALRGATLTGATVAVLITDGEPNCLWDQAMATSIVATWVTDLNIKTYVVGLPGLAGGPGMGGPGAGNGPAVLNALAMAGGTSMYIDAADMMTLQTKLTEIVTTTVKTGFDSCGMDLMPAADPVDKLQLVVSEKGVDKNVPHDLGNGGGGWTVTPDGRHIEMTGSLCEDAMGGRFETVKFEYGCKDLPPLPPEPTPD